MCFDGEPCDVFDSKWIVARKMHKCSQCRRLIPKGAFHRSINTLFEGTWERFRIHAECDALSEFVRTKICEAEGEHGFIPLDGLQEEIDSLQDAYGSVIVSGEDADAVKLMGFEMEAWDEDDGSFAVDHGAVSSWLMDCIKAQYPKIP